MSIEVLLQITNKLIKDDPDANNDLTEYIKTNAHDEPICMLAESISMLDLKKDVQLFHLEQMVENLLKAEKDISDAKHDALTGLPTRSLFFEALANSCKKTRLEKYQMALFYIDLDKFKEVNDTLGHDAGDEILQKSAERMQACIKSDDVLSRMGGDEFTIILNNIGSHHDAQAIATRLIEALQKPFKLTNGLSSIGCSIGIRYYPADAEKPVTLVENADIAMYRAKENGRNQFCTYAN